jgi:hypothetical protein
VLLEPGSAVVGLGQTQQFQVLVTTSANTGVQWEVNGVTNGNATSGTVSDSGLYTAPLAMPNPEGVTVTVVSVANPHDQASAVVTLQDGIAISVQPTTATVGTMVVNGASSAVYTAPALIPSPALVTVTATSVADPAKTGSAAVGTIVVTGATTASYTAPAILPVTNPVTIHAAAAASTVSATVTIASSVTVSVSPPSASILTSARVTLAPTVTNSADIAVTWSVHSIANGNAAVGQICRQGSNTCLAPSGASSANVDYLAPATVPTANPVTVTATSEADASKSGSAPISISAPSTNVVVTVSPSYAFLAPSGGTTSTQQFFAAVTGTTNGNVTWSVQSGVPGQGGVGTACGSINSAGLYTSPTSAPSPNAVTVMATSAAHASKTASATVAISIGPTIEIILPSSV